MAFSIFRRSMLWRISYIDISLFCLIRCYDFSMERRYDVLSSDEITGTRYFLLKLYILHIYITSQTD